MFCQRMFKVRNLMAEHHTKALLRIVLLKKTMIYRSIKIQYTNDQRMYQEVKNTRDAKYVRLLNAIRSKR